VAWFYWLSAPVLAASVTALWAWWVERPRRRPDTAAAIRDHGRYLETLAPPAGADPARGAD
jgi:hypothetical protein